MRRMPLTYQIFIGMVVGLILGSIVGGPVATQWIKPFGDIFVRLIQMLVVPLVFITLVAGAASMGDLSRLGRVAIKILVLYMVTTLIAATIGITLGNLIQPGSSLAHGALKAPEVAKAPSWGDFLVNLFPSNPVAAMNSANMLQIIIFAIFFGVAMSMAGDRARGLRTIFEEATQVIFKLVMLVMAYAPIGVAALMAWVAGTYGLSILVPVVKYLVGVIVGVFLHGAVVYGLIVVVLGGVSITRFYKNAVQFMLVAFSTRSSNAALPLNMEVAETKMGVNREIFGFTLPLGATINMDGTAIYMGLATVLIAQVYGIALTPAQQFAVIITATVASIGAAGVPGAGLVMMSLVLTAVGLPLAGIAIIAGVDPIPDMFRTTLNVTGDAACTLAVARSEGMLDKEIFYGRKQAPEAGAATPGMA